MLQLVDFWCLPMGRCIESLRILCRYVFTIVVKPDRYDVCCRLQRCRLQPRNSLSIFRTTVKQEKFIVLWNERC